MGREQFVGAWKLVASEFRRPDGRASYPLGNGAIGLLMYDPAGYVAVQIMSLRRPKFASGDHLRGTPDEIKAAFEGCVTYYGTYEVREKEHIVIHNVEGSSFPNWEGTALKRFYEFSGNRLTLSTPQMLMGGERITGVLIWERVRAVAEKDQQ